MIEVVVTRKTASILQIEVSGHAFNADPGFDLVCAGVSSIMTGALNGFDSLDASAVLELNDEPYISIKCDIINITNQTLLEFVLIQLKTVYEAHPDVISILEKEEIR